MKRFALLLNLFLVFQLGFAQTAYTQKPLVNDTSYLSWTTVENGTISPDGQYAYYRIANEPIGGNTWVILSTDKQWEVRSTQYNNLNFSPDSKYLYAMQGDSLIKLKLRSSEVTIIPHCKGYEIYSYITTKWLIYTLDDASSPLAIEDLRTGMKRMLSNVKEYSINKDGGAIVCKIKTETLGIETMQWTDLSTGRSLIIYKGTPSKNLIYDPSGNRIAFDTTNEKGQTEIRYYQRGWKESKLIANDTNTGIAENLKITTDETWRFSGDGKDLFFNLAKKTAPMPKKKMSPNVWNYQDLYLLSEYKHIEGDLHRGENLSSLNINTGRLKQLLVGDQRIAFDSPDNKNSDIIIVLSLNGGLRELSWNKATHLSYYLCFTKTGKLKPIKENCSKWIDIMALSPNSDFLVYFDPEIAKYVSYCIKDDKSEIISGSLTKELYVQQYAVRSGSELQEGNLGIVGWVKGTRKIIVHGMYDLWELDLANKVIPRNITQRIGDNNHLIFGDLESKLLESNATWILTGFNMLTKDGELYSFNYKNGIIKFLFKSNTLFSGLPSSNNIALKKADKSNCYLVRLGNAQDLPNYFVTSNFKKFDTLSNNHPEKKINWITSGLATYKDKFKKECQAILYKPENFDSLKKYPVIFYYYIESANSLNFTLDLDPSNIGVNIPILVSNGYIVCRPNIYLDINKPGDGALTSVIAVADYLKKFNWIDSTKMGIIGHSRGGYETDYIVTHTNMFAAAISAAGISNLVEYYNARNASGGESNHIYVRTQMLMTQGMEDSPNIYNENSPILAVKNISTPLLLMHNEEDNTVSVSQSTELFVQLRSMQKPVWLLQYEGEHHTISKLKNQIDFQNKVKDFFDHYLKDQPMPQWMNNPIK